MPFLSSGHQPQTSHHALIPYAKLVLLRAVDAIPEAAFQECTHSVTFDISTGIHFPDVIDFTIELAAGQVEIGGKPFFDILGSRPNTHRMLFELELATSSAPTPLGMHRLDSIWWDNLGSSEVSGAYLGHEAPLLARVGEQGLVLVTESSEEQVVGAVFGLVLQNSMGINTDSLPFGTFAIRQSFERGYRSPEMQDDKSSPGNRHDSAERDVLFRLLQPGRALRDALRHQ